MDHIKVARWTYYTGNFIDKIILSMGNFIDNTVNLLLLLLLLLFILI
jgi:hypothetical protein